MAKTVDDYIYSTGTHWIANSGKDENSGTRGSRAGDQTGHEAELRKWYSRPWTVILRHPDQTVALTIAKLSIAMCLNDRVGYDQGERTTYWKALKAADYDPSKITTPCEEDCTAGVSANVKAAGHLCGIASLEDLPICTSRNMLAQFTKAGFVALSQSKYLTSPDYLLPGDILLYENHHAACNITCGKKVRECRMPKEMGVDEAVPAMPRIFAVGDVFVRAAPNRTADRLGVCPRGGRLHWYGYRLNGWLLAAYEGRTGWVSEKYATIEASEQKGERENVE